jgi:valyl-tRNA synthetase
VRESELSIYAIEVLARLSETVDAVEAAYREYQFNTVAQRLYEFVWGDFCDWFVEAAKTDIFGENEARKQSTLATMDFVLSAVVRLLHPFMPHLTEELWSLMGFASGETDFLDFARLPEAVSLSESLRARARQRVGAIYETVEAGRNLRAEARVPSNQKAEFVLRSNEAWAREENATIARLLNARSLQIQPNVTTPERSSVAATKLGELFLVVGETNRASEGERLDKEIAKLEADLRATEAKLGNQSFIERAPKEVVEEHRHRRDDLSARLRQLRKARESLD